MIPVRGVLEKMGKTVEWDGDSRSITVSDGQKTVLLTVGNEIIKIADGNDVRTVTLDTAPVIINDKTLLPIRAVAEEFGAFVYWQDSIRSVIITTDVYPDKLVQEET